MKDYLLSIGIMTGNSLDAADSVLTRFAANGKIEDVEFFSLPCPPELFEQLKDLREFINRQNGCMEKVVETYRHFDAVLENYMQFLATAVSGLIAKAKYDRSEIDIIGFHGQTSAHLPPSIAGKNHDVYTVQIGDGQGLADLTGISVIYDFRSDDIMNGGEGAPLAPMHNLHIARHLQGTGDFPISFINGGNTGNIAHITYDDDAQMKVVGWDAGPFNHFPDLLMRQEKNLSCDFDGAIGSQGKVDLGLLRALFDSSVVNQRGENFLLSAPPKSSDPEWYKAIPALLDKSIPFETRLRTAEYFSAYILYHSLGFTDDQLQLPPRFAVFGGGWKNPVIFQHFKSLLEGNFTDNLVLEEHWDRFSNINSRLKASLLSPPPFFKGEGQGGGWRHTEKHEYASPTPHLASPLEGRGEGFIRKPTIKPSDDYGFSGQAMEARIFADMAVCRVKGEFFTDKEITGVRQPTICGIIRYPGRIKTNATENLREWLKHYQSENLTHDNPKIFDNRWSRAAAGWAKKLEIYERNK